MYHTVEVFREDRALQVAVSSSPLYMISESLGITTAGSKSKHSKHGARKHRGAVVRRLMTQFYAHYVTDKMTEA